MCRSLAVGGVDVIGHGLSKRALVIISRARHVILFHDAYCSQRACAAVSSRHAVQQHLPVLRCFAASESDFWMHTSSLRL